MEPIDTNKTSSSTYVAVCILSFVFQLTWAQNDTIVLKNNDKIIG